MQLPTPVLGKFPPDANFYEERHNGPMAINDKMPPLGPLEVFFRDEGITEIMVNDTRNVYIEKDGRCMSGGVRIQDPDALAGLARGMAEAAGRYLTLDQPYADFALPDGSRVNIVMPPLVTGPAITIRRFPKRRPTIDDLMKNRTLDQKLAYFLNVCIVGRVNVLISGGTGSGKTTLLNIFTQFIPKNERIVTIEDTPEIVVPHENSVKMQTRFTQNANQNINSRELLSNALRMRPDRIILGECRRGEALDMLQAMNTGHEGSMTTIHANSPREALYRLETLVLMGGVELPLSVVRKHIASSIDLIIQVKRFRSGMRKITQVCEVTGMEQDTILLQDLFMMDETNLETVAQSTGFVPKFLPQLQERGINIENDYFA